MITSIEPLEQTGLGHEQLLEAVQMRHNIGAASEALDEQEDNKHHYRQYKEAERMRGEHPHIIDVAGTLRLDELAATAVYAVSHAVKQRRVNKANRDAARHYRNNKIGYQEQALIEANEAGVEINGWILES